MTETAEKKRPPRTPKSKAKPKNSPDDGSLDFQVESVEESLIANDPEPAECCEVGYDSGPAMHSPEWPSYVLSQFQEHELDEDGSPYVHGLRRVTRLLLGPIFRSCSFVRQPPRTLENGNQDFTIVTHVVEIDIQREGQGRTIVEDVGDVSVENSREFAKYPARTAATQAESRCLRKLLMLPRGVVSAEEKGPVDTTGETSNQVLNVIDLLCSTERLDIDVEKLVALSGIKYSNPNKIPMAKALKIIEYLDDMLRGAKPQRADVTGYRSDWRETWGK